MNPNKSRLDDKDLRIVQMLREDAWSTCRQIGEAVHLSASAVQRRITSLKKQGVITGARATIDAALAGQRLRMFLLLELREDNAPALESLVAALRDQPEVSGVDLLAGKFDVLLTLDCEDTERFSELAMRLVNTDPNVRHCWTLTRIKQLL